MQEEEFDKFADEYRDLHRRNIRVSGEDPEFFAEYKVKDVADYLASAFDDALQVLDFGAGTGNSVPYFMRYLPSSRLTCLDVSRKSLAVGEDRFPDQADFVQFDGRKIPYGEAHFDIAFAACVFHHIEADRHVSVLSEIRRVLKPRGKIFVFEHNPLNPLTVHAVNTCPFDANAVLMRVDTIAGRMRDAGFTRLEHRYRLFFPGPLRALRQFERFLAWLPLGAQYFVVGQK